MKNKQSWKIRVVVGDWYTMRGVQGQKKGNNHGILIEEARKTILLHSV